MKGLGCPVESGNGLDQVRRWKQLYHKQRQLLLLLLLHWGHRDGPKQAAQGGEGRKPRKKGKDSQYPAQKAHSASWTIHWWTPRLSSRPWRKRGVNSQQKRTGALSLVTYLKRKYERNWSINETKNRRILCEGDLLIVCFVHTSGQCWQEGRESTLPHFVQLYSFLPPLLEKMDLPNFMTLTREVALNVKVGTFRVHFHTWDFKTKRRDRQIKKDTVKKDTDQTDPQANTPT